MKKIVALLLVLCIAASVFAVGSVRGGAAFEFLSGKTRNFKLNDTELPNTETKYKFTGLGVNVGGKYELDSNLSVWADFSLVFGFDAKFKEGDNTKWYSFKDEFNKIMKDNPGLSGKLAINSISIAAGAAYKLPIGNAPVEVSVGGGLFFERALSKMSFSYGGESSSYTNKIAIIGLSAYADCVYKITDQIGVALTIMPRFGLLGFAKEINTANSSSQTWKANGFAFSFSLPVAIGATYSF